jgi:hypothetical protein
MIARTIIALALLSTRALAQEVADPHADTVVTIDREIVTGVLTERVPDDHATLTLESGESRRFEWADVLYAGPTLYAPRLPVPPPPDDVPEPPRDEGLELALESAGAPIMFFADEGGLGTMPRTLCLTPCTTSLPRGRVQLALSSERGSPVRVAPITIEAPGTLIGRYEDRGAVRDIGWATLGIGATIGAVLAIVPAGINDGAAQAGLLLASVGVLAIAIIVGVVLGESGDVAQIRFEPRP